MTVKFILAEVRTQRGMTQEDLAKAMGMSLGGIQYWEYKATSVKLDELDRLCEVLKCEPGDFFIRYKDDIEEQNRLNREKRRQQKSERMKQWWASKRKQQSKKDKTNAA
jgi:transcriptional regulator with XRE-family HTH domain